MIVVFVIGIPLMYFALLKSVSAHLDPVPGTFRVPDTFRVDGFDDEDKKDENLGKPHFGKLCLGKLCLGKPRVEKPRVEKPRLGKLRQDIIDIFENEKEAEQKVKDLNEDPELMRNGQLQFEKLFGDEQLGMDQAIKERDSLEAINPKMRRLRFLYGNYEPKTWWFEVIETLRKLALTGGLLYLNPGTAAQIIMALLICLASMRIYSGYQPFIVYKFDVLAESVQWQLFFVLLTALAIRINLEEESNVEKAMFDWALSLLQLMGPIVLIHQFFMTGHNEELEDFKEQFGEVFHNVPGSSAIVAFGGRAKEATLGDGPLSPKGRRRRRSTTQKHDELKNSAARRRSLSGERETRWQSEQAGVLDAQQQDHQKILATQKADAEAASAKFEEAMKAAGGKDEEIEQKKAQMDELIAEQKIAMEKKLAAVRQEHEEKLRAHEKERQVLREEREEHNREVDKLIAEKAEHDNVVREVEMHKLSHLEKKEEYEEKHRSLSEHEDALKQIIKQKEDEMRGGNENVFSKWFGGNLK